MAPQRTKAPLILLATALFGGLVFWMPSGVLHILRGSDFGGVDVLVLTALLPPVAIAATFAARHRLQLSKAAPYAPLAVLLGIWILGPSAMFAFWTVDGGGFAKTDWWQGWPMLLFPPTTFIFATYDGSLGGLLLGSGVLIGLFVWFRVQKSFKPLHQVD
jgi:hypothetical protein